MQRTLLAVSLVFVLLLAGCGARTGVTRTEFNQLKESTTKILVDHETRITKLEDQDPPPNGDWESRIEKNIPPCTEGVVEFEVGGLSYNGNPLNPSEAGKDILFALARRSTSRVEGELSLMLEFKRLLRNLSSKF